MNKFPENLGGILGIKTDFQEGKRGINTILGEKNRDLGKQKSGKTNPEVPGGRFGLNQDGGAHNKDDVAHNKHGAAHNKNGARALLNTRLAPHQDGASTFN